MSGATAACVAIVRPASARTESLCVLAAVALVVGGGVVLARANAQQEHKVVLQDWQISSFHDLEGVDLATYSALLDAGDYIRVWYEDSIQAGQPHWPTVQELDVDYAVAPFARDVTWKQGGQVEWSMIKSYSLDGATVYFGNRGRIEGQAAYLLVISHRHKGATYTNQATVWISRDPNAAAPDTVNIDSLVRKGWKQVVPYTGSDEVMRLRGES
jgi:hypothetical protein